MSGYIPASESPELKAKGKARVVKNGSSTARARKSHQAHAEHFLGTHFPMSYLPEYARCAKWHSAQVLKLKFHTSRVEENSVDILSVN